MMSRTSITDRLASICCMRTCSGSLALPAPDLVTFGQQAGPLDLSPLGPFSYYDPAVRPKEGAIMGPSRRVEASAIVVDPDISLDFLGLRIEKASLPE